MELKFLGATESVTGSKHLLTTDSGKKYLLDCGLYQGMGKETGNLNRHLGFDPQEIEAVILSHAHIDHSGSLPYLVAQGFSGTIYCTPPTKAVAQVLLMDSAAIQEADIIYVNKRRKREGKDLIKPLYTKDDVNRCMELFEIVAYNKKLVISDELSLVFTNAGHILGSAVSSLSLKKQNGKVIELSFSGDVGRYDDLLMKNPDKFPQADYIICESTYGDRLHDVKKDATEALLNCVLETCIKKKGKLLIPAFSLGRTQELAYTLNQLFNNNRLPRVPIFIDSPLSTNATKLLYEYRYHLNEDVQETLQKDDDPFGFDGLKYVTEVEQSKAIDSSKKPSVIISSSGMMDAGRIKHHLIHHLSDKKNTVLIVGFCTPNSLGGKLIRGENEVFIFGKPVKVKADIKIMESYSAHADYNELLSFLSCQDKSRVKEIFLVHGETEAKVRFKEILNENGYECVTIPVKAESIKLK
ncbi:MAG: MBL fold metallo-hydrolase RNA specificity domain-containing protein [Bacteroidia bacterium]